MLAIYYFVTWKTLRCLVCEPLLFFMSHVCLYITLCHKYSYDMLYLNKYSYIYLIVQNLFQKIKFQVFNFFSKTLMLELKLIWGTILWIGSVGCLTPSPIVIELPSPRFLVRDFSLP